MVIVIDADVDVETHTPYVIAGVHDWNTDANTNYITTDAVDKANMWCYVDDNVDVYMTGFKKIYQTKCIE